jgi:hypothetical protein
VDVATPTHSRTTPAFAGAVGAEVVCGCLRPYRLLRGRRRRRSCRADRRPFRQAHRVLATCRRTSAVARPAVHGKGEPPRWTGSVMTWTPPKRVRHVTVTSDVVPPDSLGDLVEILLMVYVEPARRLILGSYGGAAEQPQPTSDCLDKWLAPHLSCRSSCRQRSRCGRVRHQVCLLGRPGQGSGPAAKRS